MNGLPGRTATRAYAAVLALIGASFALGSLLHAGVSLHLAGATLQEPRIVGAQVVEGLCAVVFWVAAVAVATWGAGAGRAVRGAHLVGICGVLVGMAALSAGRGPRTESNDLYHVDVLAAMVLTLRWYERRLEPVGWGDAVARGVPGGMGGGR